MFKQEVIYYASFLFLFLFIFIYYLSYGGGLGKKKIVSVCVWGGTLLVGHFHCAHSLGIQVNGFAL